MTERLLALVLIAAGVALLAGPGWGLVAAGVGLLVLRVELAPTWHEARQRGALARARLGLVAAAHPRRTAAAVLVLVALLALPLGVGLWHGVPQGLTALGTGLAALGVAVGWE